MCELIFFLKLYSVVKVSEDLLSQHYCQLRTKPFFPRLLDYMTSGPVVAMVRGTLILHYSYVFYVLFLPLH